MRRFHLVIVVMLLISGGTVGFFPSPQLKGEEHEPKGRVGATGAIQLPGPEYDSSTSIEQGLLWRRTVRAYKDEPLTLAEVSQLLWAAQGITEPTRGLRTAPSAGARYPLEVYVVVGNVQGIKNGVYKYKPQEHQLTKIRDGDVRAELSAAALGQSHVRTGAIVIVFSAVYERTTQAYGDRGVRYVHMEAGHAAQNVYLQAISLSLATGVAGEFRDEEVKGVLNMREDEQPLSLMPVGAYEYGSFPFEITKMAAGTGDKAQLTWNSGPGERYTIWSCPDLVAGAWTKATTVSSEGTSTTWTHPDTPPSRTLFYRIGKE